MSKQSMLLDIIGLGYNGEGIAKHEGKTVFVPFALSGEKVSALPKYEKGGCIYAKLKKVIVPSPDRVEPVCPVYTQCGGCQLQHLSYSQQLIHKADIVCNNFRKIARVDVQCAPTVPSPRKYAYRNKLVLPVAQRDGKLVFGMYEGESHNIVAIDDCPLIGQWGSTVINIVRDFMNQYDIPAYCEQSNTGLVRHIVARYLDNLSVTLVINGKALPHEKQLLSRLLSVFPDCGLYLNFNTAHNNVIMGAVSKLVGGTACQATINTADYGINFECQSGNTHTESCSNALNGALRVEVQPTAFMQVNDSIRDAIYASVTAQFQGRPFTLIDAYSGVGLTTCLLARSCERVYGIEIVKEAVDSANSLAREQGLSERITNLCGDCAVVLPDLIAKLHLQGKKTAVILDPPRKGCDRAIIDSLLSCLPDTVIYISCNSATLARDVAPLLTHYEISLTPYDMFPNTRHTETLCYLTRK